MRKEYAMSSLLQDVRYGARILIRNPGFTLIVVFTLVLGIGANTAIFSVINALILNSSSIEDAGAVAAIWRTPLDRRTEGYVSYLELQDWQNRNQSFDPIAGYKPNGFILLGDDQAELIQGMRVTANFLSLLHIQPMRGRDFQPEEEKRGALPVVILSYEFWQNRFGGDDSALS